MVSLRLLALLSATLAAALPIEERSADELGKRGAIASYCDQIQTMGFHAGARIQQLYFDALAQGGNRAIHVSLIPFMFSTRQLTLCVCI